MHGFVIEIINETKKMKHSYPHPLKAFTHLNCLKVLSNFKKHIHFRKHMTFAVNNILLYVDRHA